MSQPLIDRYGRTIEYVRMAITDRCNLRCYYCMPECGIDFVQRRELLSYEELERLMGIMGKMGVHKVRITGGEPLVRKGSLDFMERLKATDGVESMHLTTNATLTLPHVDRLAEMGLSSVNISLDTLDEARFLAIAKREGLNEVLASIDAFLKKGIRVKLNMVVMYGVNDMDIQSMLELAKNKPLEVRMIEEMPFNGSSHDLRPNWNFRKLEEFIALNFPELQRDEMPQGATAYTYSSDSWAGTAGIIAAFSRTFCGSCNRLRITPTGQLKTCLYDDGVLDLREVLRDGSTDDDIERNIRDAVAAKPKDGFEAEQNAKHSTKRESMATIGG